MNQSFSDILLLARGVLMAFTLFILNQFQQLVLDVVRYQSEAQTAFNNWLTGTLEPWMTASPYAVALGIDQQSLHLYLLAFAWVAVIGIRIYMWRTTR